MSVYVRQISQHWSSRTGHGGKKTYMDGCDPADDDSTSQSVQGFPGVGRYLLGSPAYISRRFGLGDHLAGSAGHLSGTRSTGCVLSRAAHPAAVPILTGIIRLWLCPFKCVEPRIRDGANRRQASPRSTTTGAWSDGFSPLRASRSTKAATARSAKTWLSRTRSIRIPRPWWKSPPR